MHTPLRIGTRGSRLALWQARAVATRLEAHGVGAELVVVKTTGDRLQDTPLSEAGGKRLFVKELEDALLRDEIDLAVHSAKDMPAVLPDELAVAAVLPREDARDALALPGGVLSENLRTAIATLRPSARIGTSSVRRSAQLAALVPGASFVPIRGNVDTRLKKLDAGEYDALVLACAGLRRLGFADRISASIPPDDCVPAPGQGIVAIEIRTADPATRQVLGAINDANADTALAAERAVVAALGGGCQLPLGAYATVKGNDLDLRAIVCSPDGVNAVRAHASGPASDPSALGRRVADDLLAQGAAELLNLVRGE